MKDLGLETIQMFFLVELNQVHLLVSRIQSVMTTSNNRHAVPRLSVLFHTERHVN
jgi:hypothetical protein